MDNGFIRIVSTKSTTDKGRMLENLVLNQLNPDNEIYYFSQKNECDFVLKNNTGFQVIQVCLELDDENEKREITGLLEALNYFDIGEGLLLTQDQEREIAKDNKRIIIQQVWKWLMNN